MLWLFIFCACCVIALVLSRGDEKCFSCDAKQPPCTAWDTVQCVWGGTCKGEVAFTVTVGDESVDVLRCDRCGRMELGALRKA